MKRKIISLMLAVIMILAVMPVSYAATQQQDSMVERAMSYEGCTAVSFPDVSFDWCAYFVTYVANDLGLAGTANAPESNIFPPIEKDTWGKCNWAATSVSHQINWFTKLGHGKLYYFELSSSINSNNNTVNASRDTFVPQPGDLIYFRTAEHGSYCHVALVTGYDPGDGRVFYIGGNQDGMKWNNSHVSCRVANIYDTIATADTSICAFLRPNYATAYEYPTCVMSVICPAAGFKDVNTSMWYHDDLDFAMNNGLFNGTTDTTFSPYATMTRGMMITVLYRLDGSPDVAELENHFKDIDSSTWCFDAARWAYETGVSEGYLDETLRIDNEITRAQAAKMLFSFARYKELDTSAYKSFADFNDANDVGNWATESMHWALGSGMIKGTTDTTITPDGNATRCQLAVIFARFMRYYDLAAGGEGQPESTDTPTSTETPESTDTPESSDLPEPIVTPEPTEAPEEII